MLHEEYNPKCSVEKITGRESEGVCSQDELISRKITLTDSDQFRVGERQRATASGDHTRCVLLYRLNNLTAATKSLNQPEKKTTVENTQYPTSVKKEKCKRHEPRRFKITKILNINTYQSNNCK
jgi:hypothetical protein